MRERTVRENAALMAVFALLGLGASGALGAQSTAGTPEGWRWRTDSPAEPQSSQGAVSGSSFRFTPMAPGWHVTMGPGAVLFDPRESLSGRFALSATLILFPEPTEAEYGVFVGGAALDGAEAAWTAFVVRGDGNAAVLHHVAGRTETLLPWTRYDAVVSRGSNGTAQNLVAVRAEPDSVRFAINDIVVATFARSALNLDGQFGLRIGRGVNMHITNLDATRRFAPYPRR